MPPEQAFDAFISHSSIDKPFVTVLKKRLEERGLRIWVDADEIRPGDLFVQTLDEALDASRTVLLVVSPESVASGWVKEEYARAMSLANRVERPGRIIPLILRDAPVPGFLQSRHRVDFRNPDNIESSLNAAIFGITGKKPSEQIVRGAHTQVLVDRRVATEMLLLVNAKHDQITADPRTASLIVAALALYEDLLIENIYGSTLSAIVRKTPFLDRRITFIPPLDTRKDDTDLFEDIIDFWTGEDDFRVLAARYEQRKGVSGDPRDTAAYVLRMLATANQIEASVLPHPARWPLFAWCMEQGDVTTHELVRVPSSPTDPRLVLTDDERTTVQSAIDALASTGEVDLHRFGPMRFPMPQRIAAHYDEGTIADSGLMLYELCAPRGD